MKCTQCGLENPRQSKFCRKCGEALRVHLQCSHCGSENSGDSAFCTQCGERLREVKKSEKGILRKCKSCGHSNELDVSFCVACGKEMIKAPRGNAKQQSVGPSSRTIALVIGMIFLAGLAVKLAVTFSKGEGLSRSTAAAVQTSSLAVNVDEAQVISVARNFKCACGGCGELPLATCECDMPRGALEEKNFIRGKLAEGYTVDQVIEQLDRKYGHRV